MAKQSDLENQPYLINLWCICISVASLFSAISRVLNFSSDQSEVAFLHDSSFRLFIRILLHFKGWQLDAEKMRLSNALKNTPRGESPEYMELIAVRIRKGCGKATDFSHNSIQIMSNETKKQRILKPDVAKLK
ncbi:hypothetical protein Gotri_019879, partial [Gossypium trilobum]|nr:hypothetical protein [Gossypium trilobum]